MRELIPGITNAKLERVYLRRQMELFPGISRRTPILLTRYLSFHNPFSYLITVRRLRENSLLTNFTRNRVSVTYFSNSIFRRAIFLASLLIRTSLD
jgi:hypothetical protein